MALFDGYRLLVLFDPHIQTLPDGNGGWKPYTAKALDTALEFGKWWKPDETITGHDFMEFAPISYWNKRRKLEMEGRRLNTDFQYANQILDKICAFTKSKVVFQPGNHDRWLDDYIQERPVLDGLINQHALLKCKERGIEYMPFDKIYKVGKASFVHAFLKPRTNTTKYHAARMAEDYGASIFYGHWHCFDEKTELLTHRGWMKQDAILPNDRCVTMNKNTCNLEWNDIDHVHRETVINEDFIHVQSNNVDLLIDREHGLFGKTDTDYQKINYFKAKDLLNPQGTFSVMKRSGVLSQPEELKIDDDLLRLLAWVKSEGNFYYIGNTPYVDICQSDLSTVEYIESLLNTLSLSFYREKRKKTLFSGIGKKQAYRIRVHADGSRFITNWMPKKDGAPSFLQFLSNRQFEIFLHEYIKGDGHTYRDSLYHIYSSDKSFIEYLEGTLPLHGYAYKTYWRQPGKYQFHNGRPNAQIAFHKKEWTWIDKRNNVKTGKYTGIKWCPTVKNGTIMVRRNGKVIMTQNSHQVFTRITWDTKPNTAVAIGCLSDLNPGWMRNSPNNWVNQILFMEFDKQGHFSWFAPIMIEGKFIYQGKIFGGHE